METRNAHLSEIKLGIQSGFPLIFGFIPIAITFGILARSSGVTLGEAVSFSAIVYAGGSQFLALDLLNSNASGVSIILTTFLFNFRHFIMGTSLSTKLHKNMLKWRPIVAFWTTDETYSVAYLKQETVSIYFFIPLAVIAYSSFSFGTFLGYQLGNILPDKLNASMGVAFYTMFIAILTPEVKKSFKTLGVLLTSGILNTVIQKLPFIPMGWHIIIVILLTAGIWSFIDSQNDKKERRLKEERESRGDSNE